jgi:hypothetical protein
MHSDFEEYYKSRNQGKCIKFVFGMSKSVMQATFGPKNVKLLELSGV